MREIGSEFWDVPVTHVKNGLFHDDTQWYLSGRSALRAIVRDIKKRHLSISQKYTVSLPSWCCDTMIVPFLEEGMEVHFYPVWWDNNDHDLRVSLDLNCDVLLLIEYFGYTQKMPEVTKYKGVVIRDVTHSLFSRDYSDADYLYGSLRKWCGLYTGGYAWTKDGHSLSEGVTDKTGYIELRDKAMRLKQNYINRKDIEIEGGRKGANNTSVEKTYLLYFAQAEECLEKADVACGLDRDIQLANYMDVELIRKKRRSNVEILRKGLQKWAMFSNYSEDDCPMFFPIMIPEGKRDELKKWLIKEGIYCPVHWPLSCYHRMIDSVNVKNIYENELSIVCDQRYSDVDMNRIVITIEDFWKEQ